MWLLIHIPFRGYGLKQPPLATAQQILDRDLVPDDSLVKVSDLVQKIYEMEFQWGISDGN
jgi:hypothetical protein